MTTAQTHPVLPRHLGRLAALLPALCLAWCSQGVALAADALPAKALRDPTQAPAALDAAPQQTPDALPVGNEGLSVVVREGKALLVVGTRLVAPGQQIGNYRLERITETEVWLRNGTGLRKLARFGGIERKALAATQCPDTSATPVARPANAPTTAARNAAQQAAKTAIARKSRQAAQAATLPPATSLNPCGSSPP